MLRDAHLACGTAQDIAGSGTTTVSTNSINLGAAKDIGAGESFIPFVQVVAAASGGTSVEFQVITADNAALTSNVVVLCSSEAIAVASLTALAVIPMPPPMAAKAKKQYLGFRAINVGAVTLITVNWEFVKDKQTAYLP